MFQKAIRAQLERWTYESDLDVEELAKAAFIAIDDWLDEDIIGFDPEDEG